MFTAQSSKMEYRGENMRRDRSRRNSDNEPRRNSNSGRRNRTPIVWRNGKYDGRRMLFCGALLLLALSGYELYIRMDDLIRFISSIRYMSEVKKESFINNITLVMQAPSMEGLKDILLFLMLCSLLSVICLICCNRPMASLLVIPLDAAVFLFGLIGRPLFIFTFSGLMQLIKLVPIVLIFAGSVINLTEKGLAYRKAKRTAGI